MRRLLLVLVLVVAGVAGLGFYRGWFRLATGGPDGRANLPVTVDREKVEQDKEKVKEKVQDLEQKARTKTGSGADGGKEEVPRP